MITKSQIKRHQIALEAGYTNFSKGLNRYAISRTRDGALADDLIQTTFLKTWSYVVRGGKIEMMEAFLYHILKALIIDEYRKHKSTSLDVLLEKGFEPALDDTQRFADMFDGEQAVKLIQELPVLYRKVMHMRYVQDLTIKKLPSLRDRQKTPLRYKRTGVSKS